MGIQWLAVLGYLEGRYLPLSSHEIVFIFKYIDLNSNITGNISQLLEHMTIACLWKVFLLPSEVIIPLSSLFWLFYFGFNLYDKVSSYGATSNPRWKKNLMGHGMHLEGPQISQINA